LTYVIRQIGKEFDNVMLMMDGNFRYNDDGRLQGRKHPNLDYIFYKLLYQGVSSLWCYSDRYDRIGNKMIRF